MGKSKTVKVIVSPKSAELTIGLDRIKGFPGIVKIIGSLYEAGTINVIRGGTIELWVNGLKKATATTDTSGRYHFDYTVGVGEYAFFTKFLGNDTYFPDDSPFVHGVYSKTPTSLSIDVNPLFGAPPLAVTILGRLYRDDTLLGLGGKTAELWRNGVKIKSMITRTMAPYGAYEFHDTIATAGGFEYYVYFRGDDKFEGCEAHEGADADGEPPDGNGDDDKGALGAGVLLLALLVLTQE